VKMTSPEESVITLMLRKLERYEFMFLTFLVGVTGALLIILQDRFVQRDIARDFGIALFAAGTVGMAVELHTRRHFRHLLTEAVRHAIDASAVSRKLSDVLALGSLTGDLRELGVRRFYSEREPLNFADLIEGAEPGSELRFLGVCLSRFVDRNIQGVIEKKLTHTCSVKFLILDPESAAVAEHAASENRSPLSIKKDIEGAQILHDNFLCDRIAENLKGRIVLGHYASVPAYFIFSTTKLMIVGFYLRGRLGEYCPAIELEVKEGGLSTAFSRHFDLLWESRREAVAPQLTLAE
jgi:hypothetical protein